MRDECVNDEDVRNTFRRVIGYDYKRAASSIESYRILCAEKAADPRSNCVHFNADTGVSGSKYFLSKN